MAHIPIPDGVKVCMRYSKAGQQVCNVFHVRVSDPITAPFLNTIAGAFKEAWADNLAAWTSGDVSLEAIEVTDQSVEGGIGVEYTTGLPIPGNGARTSSPNNVTVSTKLATGMTGRSRRGRFYMVGVPADQLEADKQHVNSVVRGALVDFVENLMANLALEGVNLAVASLYSGTDGDGNPIPRAAGILTDVLNASVNATLDSQRRRLPERGA